MDTPHYKPPPSVPFKSVGATSIAQPESESEEQRRNDSRISNRVSHALPHAVVNGDSEFEEEE